MDGVARVDCFVPVSWGVRVGMDGNEKKPKDLAEWYVDMILDTPF
jgi:hypothetical protein